MTAAVALAVVLVIAVAGMSLAMQTQRPAQPQGRMSRPPRPAAPPRRVRDRRPSAAPPPEVVSDPDDSNLPEPKKPELLRTGAQAEAKVLSVVDERTLGPVTRSRLQLLVDPAEGSSFEVTVRVAFQNPAERSRVKVGGTVAVRYDPDDHARVVLDLAGE